MGALILAWSPCGAFFFGVGPMIYANRPIVSEKIKDGTRDNILALRPQGKVRRGTLACKCDIFVVCCGVGGFGVGLKFWRGIRFWRGSAISLQDSGVEGPLGSLGIWEPMSFRIL